MEQNKVFLMILDGWGKGKVPESDAIFQANTPFIDSLYENFPNSDLVTFGEDVGLPEGQMGNSEVGHMNIGAGRIVYQELARINNAVRDGSFAENQVLNKSLERLDKKKGSLHIVGLLSDGGVHSHIKHLMALCDIAGQNKARNVYIHAFLDGRDTDPQGGLQYVKSLVEYIKDSNISLASLIGRYYAMDRDKRWERTKLAYDLLVHGEAEKFTTDPLNAIQESYDQGITDEFFKPLGIGVKGRRPGNITSGDTVLFFNFRTDRPRQLTEVLCQKSNEELGMTKLDLDFVTMTNYDQNFQNIDLLFEKENLKQTLGQIISESGKSQTRIAETEKYPHVTFFFNGGREKPFEREHRILIPSPKVATYDLQPEMSALEITEAISEHIKIKAPDFICLNFANTDMVGHTGVFSAAISAAEIIDSCTKQLVELSLSKNYTIIIIADHGNCDYMINEDGSPNTAHTKNLVPFILVSNHFEGKVQDGKLGDLAPTILTLMGLDIPKEVTGTNLILSE